MNLNNFADSYAGILALVGLALTVLFGALAVYFYYNPRRPSYRVMYKVFSRNLVNAIARDGSIISRSFHIGTPDYAIDIWNAGREPITPDVMRKSIKIALQAEDVSKGVRIESFGVDSESHPGSSEFQLQQTEERLSLGWRHFDPGMCVRIRLKLNHAVNDDRIAVFGEGLRLELKKARIVSEMKGLPSWMIRFFVLVVPGAGLVAASGLAVTWLSTLDLAGAIAYMAGVPALLGAILMIMAAVALGAGLNSLIEWLMNVRSPLERTSGRPFLGHRTAIRRIRSVDGRVIEEVLEATEDDDDERPSPDAAQT